MRLSACLRPGRPPKKEIEVELPKRKHRPTATGRSYDAPRQVRPSFDVRHTDPRRGSAWDLVLVERERITRDLHARGRRDVPPKLEGVCWIDVPERNAIQAIAHDSALRKKLNR